MVPYKVRRKPESVRDIRGSLRLLRKKRLLGNMLPTLARASRALIRSTTVAPVLVIAGVIASCASSRPDELNGEPRPEVTAEPVYPNHCRIEGTILEVQGPDPGAPADDPCSKYPCTATIRVDSILGYGSAFPAALAPAQRIQVRFEFTLAPSSEAFPNETFSLPGLMPGDRFGADVSGSEAMTVQGPQGGTNKYGVALYRKLK